MDPGSGRRWRRREEFLSDLYIHSHQLSSKDWREWAGSENFLGPLDFRMRVLGLNAKDRRRIIAGALADPSAGTLATLDAAVRLCHSLASEGAVERGAGLVRLLERAMNHPEAMPESWYSARIDPADPARITIRGAVLIRFLGVQKAVDISRSTLSPELADALTERVPSPMAMLLRTLRGSLRFQALLFGALALSAIGVVAEAVLFQALFDLARLLTGGSQRYFAVGVLGMVFAAVTLIEFALTQAIFATGRKFEGSVRMLFKTRSAAVYGIEAYLVDVEVNISTGGNGQVVIVGLPDTAVRESRNRVLPAIRNNGFGAPYQKIVINLGPADVKKEGSAFDLPMM